MKCIPLIALFLGFTILQSSAQEVASADLQTRDNFSASTSFGIMRIQPIAAFRFDETAYITATIPPNYHDVTFRIVNAIGKLVYSHEIDERGNVYFTIFGRQLSQGNYTCYLVSGNDPLSVTSFKVLGR